MDKPDLNALAQALSRHLSRRRLLGRAAVAGAAQAALTMVGRPAASAVAPDGRFGGLSGLPGVALAVEWAADGTLVDYESPAGFPRRFAEDAAKYGAVVSAMAPRFAETYSTATALRWKPYKAMVVYGGEWVAVVGNGNRGVWVRPSDADVGQVVRALQQKRGLAPFPRLPRRT